MSDLAMTDFDLVHRPVLGAASALLSDRISLAPLAEGCVLQIFGAPTDAGRLAEASAAAGLSMRANGPGQWYLVGDQPLAGPALAALTASLAGFTVVDQSHGRVRIAVAGEAVESVLAKGTGIDLARFAVGDATSTLVGHVAAHLTRTAADRFELMPLRSFAESLWHDLETMAAEYAAIPARAGDER